MASCRIVTRTCVPRGVPGSFLNQSSSALNANANFHQTSSRTLLPPCRHKEVANRTNTTNAAGVCDASAWHQTTSYTSGHLSMRKFFTSCSLSLLEDVQSCTEHTSLLMLIGQNRAKLDENHVSQALIQLWEVMKFIPNRRAVLEHEVHSDRDFLSLCVLAENKVHLMEAEVLADTLYAAIKLLSPDNTHSLIRELRNKAMCNLDNMTCKQLSKIAVCLNDLHEWRTPSCGAVTHAFGQKLDTVEDIRELSAWMRECLPLASQSLSSQTFTKALQYLDQLDVDFIGKNDLRRIVQTAVKVPGANHNLIEKCAQLFLHKMEKGEMSLREVCAVYHHLKDSLNYRGQNIQARVASYIRDKLPDSQDGAEVAVAIEVLADRANAETKFLIEDKALEVIDDVPLAFMHQLCRGLRMINYGSMTPLTRKIINVLMSHRCQSLPTDSFARIIEFLNKIDGIDDGLYRKLYRDLLSMLKDSISPGRSMYIIYCISILPLASLSNMVFRKASDILPQLHTHGINQLLSSIVRISKRLQKEGPLPNSCASLLQDVQELAIRSINQVTSVHYLNNIMDFLLEEGDQDFLVGVAMQRYSHVLSKLTPQTAVECARYMGRARYVQPALLDKIADIVTKNINKITPLQISFILGPFSSLNFQPPNVSELYEACINRIVPFLDSLPAGYVVDVANICALSQRFPEPIVKKIFSLEFLTKLDEELEAIPDRSMMYRRKLMYLNRTLALEAPEMQVPWFHEDFCRDSLKSRRVLFHSSVREVQNTLAEVLGGPQFLRSFVIAPYHYEITFECVLDAEGNPLPCADYGSVLNRLGGMTGGVLADLMQWGTQTKHLPDGAQRVAIDYLFSSSYCTNSRHPLGFLAMKKRHLELMGYKYIPVPYFEWHSAQLAEREDRVQYLEQNIFQDLVPTAMETDTISQPSGLGFSGEEEPALAFDGLTRAPDPDLMEDPLVMRVLHTFDRINRRRP